MFKDAVACAPSAPDPVGLQDWEDGATLVSGIQAVMQNMCSQIVNLTQDNNQLNDEIVRLKEEREAMEELNEVFFKWIFILFF